MELRGNNDVVNDEETALLQPNVNAFDDESTRRGFLCKIFMILTLQLTVITACVATTMSIPSLVDYFTHDDYYQLNMILGCAASTVVFVSLLSFVVIPGLPKQKTATAIMFTVVTVFAAIMISIFSTVLSNTTAMTLLGICASCCLGISGFVLNRKYDIISWQGAAFVFLWGLLSTGVTLVIPVPFSSPAFKIIVGLVATGMMALLITTVNYRIKRQTILTKDPLEPDQYLAGALELFGVLVLSFSVIIVLFGLLVLFIYCGRKRSGFERIGDDN